MPDMGMICNPTMGSDVGFFYADDARMNKRLKDLREARGWSQQEAADALGMSHSGYVKWERGDRGLSDKARSKIARVYGVSKASLEDDSAPPAPEPPANYRPPPQFLGERTLPVFSAVEGGPGFMVVSTDAIEFVSRPWYLGEVREGYAVLVVGESMSPAYEPGDMAIVNPKLPIVRGRTYIFAAEGDGEFKATIKRLVGHTADYWEVEQHNPPTPEQKRFKLPKAQWPRALRVVGRYEG